MQEISIQKVVSILLKYKGKIILVVGTALILSVVFSSSYFIKPKYKSVAVLYPSNISPYGQETQTEQMLQMMQSKEIFDGVVKKFNLGMHYELDTTSKTYMTELIGEFEENVEMSKTEYESVKIKVMDTDPVVASNMIKEIVRLFNAKVKALQLQKYMEIYDMHDRFLIKRKKEIDSLEAVIKELRMKFNVLDYDIQTKEAYRGYYNGLQTNNQKLINESSRIIKNLEEKGGEYLWLKQQIFRQKEFYSDLKIEHDKALKDVVDRQITYDNIISQPFPADKKSYPIRWLIVLTATLSALLFSLLLIFIIESNPFKKTDA